MLRLLALVNWIRLKNLDTGEEMKFQLVNPQEADIFENKISVESPLGRSIINNAKRVKQLK